MTNESDQTSGAKPAETTQPAPVQKPMPTPTPFPVASPGVSKQEMKEVRTKGQRYLFINVLLMFLVSIVVFTIGSFFFLVPRIVTQDIEIRQLESKMGAVRESLKNTRAALVDLRSATAPAGETKPEPAPPAETEEADAGDAEEAAVGEKKPAEAP
jgi:hypothetical protein